MKSETTTVSRVTLRDLRKCVAQSVNKMDRESIKNLVNTYYDIQGYRIIIENRIAAAKRNAAAISDSESKTETPKTDVVKTEDYDFLNDTITTYADRILSSGLRELEDFIKNALKAYVDSDPIGRWCTSIMGIGPVIAAGLLSYIDIDRCQTAGCIWSYAGISGNEVKKKGEKFNYSPKFKTLCWKIGQSFIKTSNNPKDIYGHLYKEKKAFYVEKNNNGGFAERAKEELATKKITKDSALYKTLESGKLSDAHINAMASRFAVKIFLSHLFEVWYEYHNGEKPPKPFVEAHLGHVHIIGAPNRELLFDE